MATVDSLDIQIQASVQKANQEINKLVANIGKLASSLKFDTSSLEKLGKINGNNFKKLSEGLHSFANSARSLEGISKTNFNKLASGIERIASIDHSKLEALGKIDGNSFRGIGDGVKSLSSGLQNLQGVKKSDFNRLATGMERLSEIQAGNMETVGNALKPLADGINILSNTKFDNKNLQSFINSLTRLSNANTGNLANIDFSALGNSINGLAQTLSKAKEVKQNTISMTNAIAKLASAGGDTGKVTAALPHLANKLKEFMQTMSGAKKVEAETIAFIQAIGTLASAGKRAAATVESLDILGDKLKAFFEKMSAVPSVSQNTIRMTEALASLAGQGGRTASITNNLGNSISRVSGLMRGFHGSTGKAINGLKSFSRQILSSMGIYLGIYGAIRGVKNAIDISSQLTEVQNVVDVTFGNMAYKVEEFAETSIEKFGMSELALKQYSSRFQAMGTAMGISSGLIENANSFLNEQTNGYIELSDSMADVSLNLTKLTADMASLYDMEQKAVAEDLASIFTGQTRPLRTYGLDLTQATLAEWAMKNGLDANIQSMSQAEKTMLRYQYVLANTKAAQGDFARTQYTWANQVRILKQNFQQLAAVIGGVLVNAFKPVVIAINKAMSGIIAFAKTISNALGKIFGWKYEEGGGASSLPEDFGSAADSAGDMADSTGQAAKNVEKIQKGLRGFDELKTISLPDSDNGSGGGGGAGGGAGGTGATGGDWIKGDSILKEFKSEIDSLYELGKYIGDTLAKAMEGIDWDSVYQKARNFGKGLANFLNGLISPRLFSALGSTVAGSINTALHFLDSFGKTFNWKNFGKSLGAGLNSFMKKMDWKTALSAAKNWGTGIANALNSFLYETDFSMVGSTVANALNTAVQFALSLGSTIDFKAFGEKLADSINSFFKTFSFKNLAETINVWVKGALDMASSLLKKTDFELIGKKIGEFLVKLDIKGIMSKLAKVLLQAVYGAFKALKGMLKSAPIETVLVAAFAILKFTKIGKTVSSNLLNVLKLSVSNVLLKPGGFSDVLKNGLTKSVDVAKNAFSGLKNLFSGGNFFGNLADSTKNIGSIFGKLNDSIKKIRDGMSPLAKGITGAVSAFATFDTASTALEEVITGSKNLKDGIIEIGVEAGIASAAMYTAFGPAGLAIEAVALTVGAIKGINDAYDELKTETTGKAIHDSLSNPGGVSIYDLSEQMSTSIRNIGDEFSSVSQKSNELDTAESNIEDIKSKIQLVEEELKAGTITSEEATQKFNSLLSELQTAVSTKIGAINQYMVTAFGEGGAWGKAWENAGFDASEAVGKTLGLTSDMQVKFNELVTELANTNPTSPRWQELQTQLYGVIGETDGLEQALTSFDYNISAINIDYSKLVPKDGEFNSQEVENVMSNISSAVQTANSDIDVAGQEMAKNLQEAINSAKEAGDSDAIEYFSQKLEELPKVIQYQKDQVSAEAKNMTDTLQTGLIENIRKIASDSFDEWGKMTDTERAIFGNAGAFAENNVNEYIDKVITPFSDSIEQEMGNLGINGAGWSKTAGEKIQNGILESSYDTSISEATKSNLTGEWNGIIDEVVSQTEGYAGNNFEGVGKESVSGYEKGLGGVDKIISAAESMIDSGIKAARNAQDSHSPSVVYEGIGKDAVDGYNKGLENNSESTKKAISDWIQNAITAFKTKWKEFEDGIKTAIQNMWSNNIKPQFTTEKWKKNIGSPKDAMSQKWKGMKSWFSTDAIPKFWSDFESKYTSDKWKSKIGSIKSAMKERWDDFKRWWDNLKVEFPKIKMPHFSMSGEFNLETGSVPTVNVQYYAAGGFPEDGWFRASHGEIMGRFDNGQSVVANNMQITEGIAAAVYPAVYNAVSSAIRNNGGAKNGNISVQIELDGDVVYKNVLKRTKEQMGAKYAGRLVLADELY